MLYTVPSQVLSKSYYEELPQASISNRNRLTLTYGTKGNARALHQHSENLWDPV